MLLLSGIIPLFCKENAGFLEVGLPVCKKRSFNDLIKNGAPFSSKEHALNGFVFNLSKTPRAKLPSVSRENDYFTLPAMLK